MKEFLAHFDAVTENSKKKKGIQWFLQAVTTYRHKSTERVAPVAASRFARTFRRRCDKMGVVIKELLDARLTSLPTDPLVSRGILNLEEMRLRDTHVIALAFTLKAVPIFWDVRAAAHAVVDVVVVWGVLWNGGLRVCMCVCMCVCVCVCVPGLGWAVVLGATTTAATLEWQLHH